MLTGSSTPIASHYYQLNIGGDLAAVKGLIKAVLQNGELDREFIDQHTDGFERLLENIQAQSCETIVEQSGLSKAQIEEAATIYNASKATISCWDMGITQHQRSVATIQMLMNCLLLKGYIGKPGAGPCPVRGHSNVQGDI